MNHLKIAIELKKNQEVFRVLLNGLTKEEFNWKPELKTWCLLEVICHLYDEEREDFRIRIKQILKTPTIPLSPIEPIVWVQKRKYLQQNFNEILQNFIIEREQSISWLQSLESPKWYNTFYHPKLGKMSAKMLLYNWLAHDYLHIRQILKLKFNYLQQQSGETLNYAGNW